MVHGCLILSVVLCVAGVCVAVWLRSGLPDSISAVVYELPNGCHYAWTLWLWCVAFLLVPALLTAMPARWEFVSFLCTASLVFVGAMPLVADEANKAHYALSIAAGVTSQLCVLVLCPAWLLCWLLWFVWVSVELVRRHGAYVQHDVWNDVGSKGVLMAEAVCMVTVYGAVMTG